MGGLNCVVFTAGIGENSPLLRQMICEDLEFLGVELDEAQNQRAVGGKTAEIINKAGERRPFSSSPPTKRK